MTKEIKPEDDSTIYLCVQLELAYRAACKLLSIPVKAKPSLDPDAIDWKPPAPIASLKRGLGQLLKKQP